MLCSPTTTPSASPIWRPLFIGFVLLSGLVSHAAVASADSGAVPTHLPVSFTVASGPCTVGTPTLASDGTSSVQITPTGAGKCGITATQGGNDTYAPANPVTQNVTINPVATQVTIATIPSTPFHHTLSFTAAVSPLTVSGQTLAGSVAFAIDNTTVDTEPVDSTGKATSKAIRLTQDAGPHTLTATFTSTNTDFAGAHNSAPFTITQETTTLTSTGATTGDYHDPATVKAQLLEEGDAARPISGKSVSFTLGSAHCQGMTDNTGTASCQLTPISTPGTNLNLAASFAGDPDYIKSAATPAFTVTKEETGLTWTASTQLLNGSSVQLSGVLTEDGITPITGRSLTLSLGSGSTLQSCPASPTSSTGSAACSLTVKQSLGSVPAAASFAGDAYYRPAGTTGQHVLVYAFPTGGSAFVIGDRSAASALSTSAPVTWWGPQWAKNNVLSGGSAPDSFFGYTASLSTTAPTCGATWTTTPGKSLGPPKDIPSTMAVLVASQVSKNGNTISGNSVKLAIVQTKPAVFGTGQVLSIFCPGNGGVKSDVVSNPQPAIAPHPPAPSPSRGEGGHHDRAVRSNHAAPHAHLPLPPGGRGGRGARVHHPFWQTHRHIRDLQTTGTTPQSITFPAMADHTFGDAPFTITAESVTTNPTTPNLPPDPSTLAPPLDETVSTGTYASTQFLYTGTNPIQTGVAPGTIDQVRVAVLRGHVTDLAGNPLPGVTVTVLDHPEFGQTLTRVDGAYDLAVNGGGAITLDFNLSGYLPASRSVQAPWSDYTRVDDLALAPYDSNVTTIDFSQPEEVARGSVVTDSRGTRQDTLLFPQGDTATYVMPDGSTVPASGPLHVRITEFTQGPNALQAMPAALPPTSAFTYCVDYSTDEEVAMGAKLLTFSSPVVSYHENNLGWPVGSVIPVGSYDQQQGQWVPDNNGRVVGILDVQSGQAVLDVDGQGQPATGTELSALGITSAELTEVAQLYSKGQSLWRVPLPHFSQPIDYNGGVIPGKGPGNANQPIQPGSKQGSQQSGWGSIDRINQSFSEQAPVAGTPFSLHYTSTRTPGYVAGRTVTLPLIQGTPDPSLNEVKLDISILGQLFHKDFAPKPNLQYTFTWDGKDAYGRPIQGSQRAFIWLTYIEDDPYALYTGPGRAFAAFPTSTIGIATGGLVFGQSTVVQLGTFDPRPEGLGGWTLNVHHSYDPQGRTLYLGDGTQRAAEGLPNVITTYGGNGNGCPNAVCDDGKLATKSAIQAPHSVAVAADGTLYYDDDNYNRIREIGPDGIVHTVAGGGSGCAGQTDNVGDGCLATQASLFSPLGLAIGPDGSLYFIDTYDYRIRRIAPNGIITTVAGNGQACNNCPLADNVPARSAPLGAPNALAVGPDGAIYFDDNAHWRLIRVSTDDIQHVVAGNGHAVYSYTPAPALQFPLYNLNGLAVGPDGAVYMAGSGGVYKLDLGGKISALAGQGIGFANGVPAVQTSTGNPGAYAVTVGKDGTIYFSMLSYGTGHLVREISPDGYIRDFAGQRYTSDTFGGDGGPADNGALYYAEGLALGPDGSLYIADALNYRIRRVAAPLPGVNPDGYLIPSTDGTQIYHFDVNGRHLATLNALSGAAMYSFGYDNAGRLATITDGDHNITSIQHDGKGNATGITAPFGQTTTLTMDANGYLNGITDPTNATEGFSYDANGLLQSITGANHETYTATYGSLGYLTSATDPGGGSLALAGADIATGRQVAVTSGLGLTTTETRNRADSAGAQHETLAFPDGTQTEVDTGYDGSHTLTDSSGLQAVETIRGDPRFGLQAPVQRQLTLSMPSGLTHTHTGSKTASLSNPTDLLSLTSETGTVTDNNNTFTAAYTASTGTVLHTSPTGRTVTETLDAQGRDTSLQLGTLNPAAITYDGHGRIASTTQVNRSTSLTYGSDGYLATLTSPLGTIALAHDADGRVTQLTRPDGQHIGYGYDAEGNPTSVTPAGRPATTLAYNPVGLLSSVSAPDVGSGPATTQYSYNIDRQLTGITYPGNQSVSLGYDGGGRLASIGLDRGTITLGYNSGGRLTSLVAPVSGNTTETLTNSGDGVVLIGETWSGPVAGSVSHTYNTDFNPASESINGGNTVSFQYDNDNLLSAAGDLTISRDGTNGEETGTTLGTVASGLTYDALGQISGVTTSAANAPVLSESYVRDAAGRITQRTETAGNGAPDIYTYQYDADGRLTQVQKNSATVESYQYDSNGNRTGGSDSGGPITATYNAQDEIVAYNGNTYSYTPSGSLASINAGGGGTTTYQYDALDNLLAVNKPDGTAITYVVDGKNERVGKLVNGNPVQGFLYDAFGRVVAELDGSNTLVSRFVYAGSRTTTPVYMVKGGVEYRIISDRVGSPVMVINSQTGQVAQALTYDAFGRVLQDTNPGFQPFGFGGGLYDRDTGLVRLGARDYDPVTGRWTTRDPAGFAGQDTNLYDYAFGDPVNAIDPSGLGPYAHTFFSFVGIVSSVVAIGLGIAAIPVVSTLVGAAVVSYVVAQGVYGTLANTVNLYSTLTNQTTVPTGVIAGVAYISGGSPTAQTWATGADLALSLALGPSTALGQAGAVDFLGQAGVNSYNAFNAATTTASAADTVVGEFGY